jgi:hypothetical protein
MPWAPSRAGDADTDGGNPTPGKELESGWNPTFTCVNEPGDTIDDVLECLADGIAHPPPSNPCPPTTPEQPDSVGDNPVTPSHLAPGSGSGDDDCSSPQAREDFVVTLLPWPRVGIRILRLEGTEIDRLWLRENDPGIQMIHLEVNRENLRGRIGEFIERPSRAGGIVTVTVNGRPIHLNTGLFSKPTELTTELRTQLRQAGFEVIVSRSYLVVMWDTLNNTGIMSVGWQSEDPSIASSDLALLPESDLELDVGSEPDPLFEPTGDGGPNAGIAPNGDRDPNVSVEAEADPEP